MSPKESVLTGKGSSSKHRPDCFGPFSVHADLGASRFGPVYLGKDPSTNKRVVIRTFELSRERREFGAQSELLDSFRKLCETTLDHHGLARPLASGAEGEIPYLVYSDLAGTAMAAIMRQHGPRPVSEVLERARQLADAIDCAASAGIYHGMMTPDDVILDGDQTGVTGFGLAQSLIKAGIAAEAVSPYGSPQRIAGAPPTRADDIYSLAAITLELLIGTPRDPEQDTSRALREAQGLPERRRLPRPAPHETRLFTTIAGVDAGKLRAAFAAAFCEDARERPSTATDFVATVQDAFSNRRVIDEPAPSVVAVTVTVAVPPVSDEHEDEPPVAAPEPPPRQEPIIAGGRAARRRRARERRRQKATTSQPLVQESHEHELRERASQSTTPETSAPETRALETCAPETRVARPDPIDDVALLAEVAALRDPSTRRRSPAVSTQPGSRALLVTGIVAVGLASFATGFGGGFVFGQQSRPSIAEPQSARAATTDPPSVVASTPSEPSVPIEKVSSPEPIAAPVPQQTAAPAANAGRLLVRSTPVGAGVVVDGQSRGVTPLALRDLAFGAHTIEVSHPDHDTRQRRVTLTERRPTRTIDVSLRPTGEAGPATAATTATGSLQVASRPAGAQVFLDDNLIGTTPLLLSNVAAGPRSVRIEMSGYQIWTTAVQIKPSARLRLSASLEP